MKHPLNRLKRALVLFSFLGGSLLPLLVIAATNTYTGSVTRAGNNWFSATAATSSGDETMEMWIKLASQPPLNDNYTLMIHGVGNPDRSFSYIDRGGVHSFQWYNNTDVLRVGYDISNSTWTHVAAVWTASSKNVNFFVNGVTVGNQTGSANPTAATDLEVGGASGQNMDGLLDDARFYTTALTGVQILADYNCGLNAPYTNLLAYYPLDNSLLDSTANHYDLTNHNSATFQNADLPFTTTCSAATSAASNKIPNLMSFD